MDILSLESVTLTCLPYWIIFETEGMNVSKAWKTASQPAIQHCPKASLMLHKRENMAVPHEEQSVPCNLAISGTTAVQLQWKVGWKLADVVISAEQSLTFSDTMQNKCKQCDQGLLGRVCKLQGVWDPFRMGWPRASRNLDYTFVICIYFQEGPCVFQNLR